MPIISSKKIKYSKLKIKNEHRISKQHRKKTSFIYLFFKYTNFFSISQENFFTYYWWILLFLEPNFFTESGTKLFSSQKALNLRLLWMIIILFENLCVKKKDLIFKLKLRTSHGKRVITQSSRSNLGSFSWCYKFERFGRKMPTLYKNNTWNRNI